MRTKDGAREENLLNAMRSAAATPPTPHGCVCPPGAEATCRGWSCPRNPPMGQKFIDGQLVWSR